MAHHDGSRSRVRFGTFEADIAEGALWKRGIRVRLQNQPFQILAALLERPNEIISREELRQRIWSDDTFVDFEHRLNAAVNKLRQALLDSAENPRYIETVAGRGYRFIAASEPIEPGLMRSPVTLHAPNEPVKQARKWLRYGAWALTATGFAAGLIAGWLLHGNHGPQAVSRLVQFTVPVPAGLISEPAFAHQDFAISPDGSRLAFVASDFAESQLWTHDLRSAKNLRLTTLGDIQSVQWSSDGESVFFDERFTVRRIPSNGGASLAICEVPGRRALHALLEQNTDLLLFTRAGKAFRVPQTGGLPSPALGDDRQYHWPQRLPDGSLLYVSFDGSAGIYRAWLTSAEHPEHRTAVIETDSRVQYSPSLNEPDKGYLLYVRAGTLVAQPFSLNSQKVSGQSKPLAENIFWFEPSGSAAFSSSQNGVLVYRTWQNSSRLKWVDRHGRTLGAIWTAQSFLTPFRLSPDGGKLAAAIYDPRKGGTDIWIYDFAREAESRLTRGPGQMASPVWAPDSNRLAFIRAFGSEPKLYRVSISSKETEQPFVTSDAFQLPTDWSHDGRFLVYQTSGSIGPPKAGMIVLDLARNSKRTSLSASDSQELAGTFSPDGSLMAFLSTETGRAEAYIQPFEAEPEPHLASKKYRVSSDGASLIRWPMGSKDLFYLSKENWVTAVPVERHHGELRLGAPQKLFHIETPPQNISAGGAVNPGFDVSADGQRFIVTDSLQLQNPPFVVVENWQKLIER